MTTCPAKLVTPEIWLLLKLTRDLEQGLLPVAGGVLDQTASFADGAERVRHEQRLIEEYKRGRQDA